jgi:hypothetical protein
MKLLLIFSNMEKLFSLVKETFGEKYLIFHQIHLELRVDKNQKN